ncbi:MAG: ParB N-terminal domain-containing protein, partial [Chloroflexota bacterium]
MSDKPKRRYGPSAFGELSDSPTAGDVADGIFGASRTTKSIRAKPTDIMKIKPDPVQPRRSVPSELRSAWAGNPHRMVDMFDMWTKRIREERGGSELKWKNILEGDDSLRGTEAETLKPDKDPLAALTELPETGISTLESNFLRLVDLAASIKRDGLTNPITVVKASKDQFIIETGERRWLAYHLLKMVYGEKDWGDIPARHVDGLSVWRQASENNARSDLNAISKARQLALLLMALYAEEHEFEPLEHFEHEQEFYAQVADGQKWRVPRNHGEKLLNAMGLST